MRILVIGSGGREHALAWKLLQSPRVQSLVLAPGNDAALAQLQHQFENKYIMSWPESIAGPEALQNMVKKADQEKIDFVVVGPDNALAEGAVDLFSAAGFACFGPTQAAARLESSKIFSKTVMKAAGIPTAEFHEAHGLEAAQALLKALNWQTQQWVIKADGLALGKGVEICETLAEAQQALQRLKIFSSSFVIEERLSGSEISWLAFCDGDECSLLPPARDYKTLTDDPLSPNTGGMGAVCPVPNLPAGLAARVRDEVFLPLLTEMKKRGTPYKGVLYAGLMIRDEKFWVLEFNARFGDPEAQALMAVMQGDLLDWCEACTHNRLQSLPREVPIGTDKAIFVVAAAEGYPQKAKSGTVIEGLSRWITAHHGFFAGVRRQDQTWVTSGGRVLGALGLGETFTQARAQAFSRLEEVHFAGQQVRESVGKEWIGPRIAILASGRGSNFEALASAAHAGQLQAEIALLVSDRPGVGALDKAHEFGIETLIQKDQNQLIAELQKKSIEWIVLAGFKRILSQEFIAAFADPRGFSRIVNIHPSLLPAFPGLHSYEQAFNYGVKFTGITVHLVDQGLDTGPVCAQEVFSIEDCKTAQDVEALGLRLEHKLYPSALNWILQNKFIIEHRGGRLHVQSR